MKQKKKELGYTNEMVSALSGVPLGTVQKVFAGATPHPRYETLQALEKAFKDEKYYSDITLGDAWKVEKEKSDWADDKGTSIFIVRSVKGELLLQKISEKFIFCETEYSKWEEYNPSIKKATDKPIERAKFFEDFIGMDSENFWSKYSKIATKRKIRYKIKCLLKITKIEKIVRRFVN